MLWKHPIFGTAEKLVYLSHASEDGQSLHCHLLQATFLSNVYIFANSCGQVVFGLYKQQVVRKQIDKCFSSSDQHTGFK